VNARKVRKGGLHQGADMGHMGKLPGNQRKGKGERTGMGNTRGEGG